MQAWGGPAAGYDWGDMEHRLSVDHQDNVWITFHNPLERSWSAPLDRTDDMILKFTSKGKFIRQFGGRDRHALRVGANTDTTSVHLATEVAVFPKTNEAFIADGYGNRRVLVLDAETLAFKRMWGAFGKQPPPALGRGADGNTATTTDPNGPEHFNSVHAVKLSHDGLVFVGDRSNRRVQVFSIDGKYVGQVFVNPTAKAFRTASGLAFSGKSAAAVPVHGRLRKRAVAYRGAEGAQAGRIVWQVGREARRIQRPPYRRRGLEREYVDRRDPAEAGRLAGSAAHVSKGFRRPRGNTPGLNLCRKSVSLEMKQLRYTYAGGLVLALVAGAWALSAQFAGAQHRQIPRFVAEAGWPKPGPQKLGHRLSGHRRDG